MLQAVSIVFFTETWRPQSFYPKILANRQHGLHTLCLLDIQVKEPSLESLARGKKVWQLFFDSKSSSNWIYSRCCNAYARLEWSQ